MPRTIELPITGMHCAACVAHVEKSLARTPGVQSSSVSLMLSQATVTLDDAASDQAVIEAITDAGYTPGAVRTPHTRDDIDPFAAAQAESRAWARAAIISIALMLPVVVLGMSTMHPPTWNALTQLALALLAQGLVGYRFYRGALSAILNKRADMDLLIALGSTAALATSTVTLVRALQSGEHLGHLYFESAVVILALVSLGKYLESRARARASSALQALMTLAPRSATLIEPTGPREIALADIRPGMTLLVRPGEKVPCDGTVIDGRSSLDQSLLTGESLPVDRAPGDAVFAGALNTTGALHVRADRDASTSLLAQIIELVRRAQASKPRIQRRADAVAGVFVPIVIAIALAALLAWGIIAHDWSRGLTALTSVLLIACPCAIGLAVPACIMVASSMGSSRGILIKDAAALERAAVVNTAILDKTGTLTTGELRVVAIETAADYNPRELLRLAAGVEANSEHPIARAIVKHARELSLPIPSAREFVATPGVGVSAIVEGVRVELRAATDPSATFTTRITLYENNTPRGSIALADTPRPRARAAIDALHELGLTTVLCSGDRLDVAQSIASELNITTVLAPVLPHEKLAHLQSLQQSRGPCLMLGDGLNDAPALAAADVGIAMGTGTDAAQSAGHVVLLKADLSQLPTLIRLARATMRRIHQTLAWAMLYNAVLIPVAAWGVLNPMLAAGAMSLSSVSVVVSALWLRRARID